MDSKSGSGPTAFVLAGLILLLGGAGAAALLPLVRCPNCNVPIWKVPETCFRCKDRRSITLLDRWRRGDARAAEWDGRIVSAIRASGFANTKKKRALGLLGIRPGDILTADKKDAAIQSLMGTNDYIDVQLSAVEDSQSRDKVILSLFVVERSSALLDEPGSPDE